MTVKPNHLHLHHDDTNISFGFGHYYNTHVVNIDAHAGHTPYVKIWFTHGLSVDLTRADAVSVVRELQAQLAVWPEPRENAS